MMCSWRCFNDTSSENFVKFAEKFKDLRLRIQSRLIFANVICCSSLWLWEGYFIYFEFYVCVVLFDVFGGCSTSIKDTHREKAP